MLHARTSKACPKQQKKHPLNLDLQRLGVNRAEIARRYGASYSFIQQVLHGSVPCPDRLRDLLDDMITERRAELAKILEQTQ